MALPFDATLKGIVLDFQRDYEAGMGLGDLSPLTLLNVDLSTLSAATDIALGHGDPPDRVIDLNFQSGPDDDLVRRALLYHAVLHYRYRVPVHTILILLRPISRHGRLTGRLRYAGRPGKGRMDFSYEVIRLWRQPARRYLEGGLGLLPLAPLCGLPEGSSTEEAMAAVIRQINERLEREAPPEARAKLLTATYILAGLRVPRPAVDRLFQGVQIMLRSSTYDGILEDGRAEGRIQALQGALLRMGRIRFGRATKAVQKAVNDIKDQARLERMTERFVTATSWQELLDTP